MPKILLSDPDELANLCLMILWAAMMDDTLFSHADIFQNFMERTAGIDSQLMVAKNLMVSQDPQRRIDLKRMLPVLSGAASQELLIRLAPKGKEIKKPSKIKQVIKKLLGNEQLSMNEYKNLRQYFELEDCSEYIGENKAIKWL